MAYGTTVAKNRIVRQVAPKSIFASAQPVLSSAVSFNQGDLIAFDTTDKILKAVTADTDGANILGVAPVSVSGGKIVSPYQGTAVDAAQAITDMSGPIFGVVAKLKLLAGDAFEPGDKVYLTVAGDAQTVTSTDPGDHMHVGIYQGVSVGSAAAGQEGEVLVGARYGLDGLSV
jgi:hypothetical protein